MTKQEQFLWAVQTAILANCNNVTSFAQDDPDYVNRYRHTISASGVMGMAHDALYASERIPDHMTAADAAVEFCGFMLDNLRDTDQEAEGGDRPTVPSWFARY